jgi:GNAT superfamily N-acetyltransferase
VTTGDFGVTLRPLAGTTADLTAARGVFEGLRAYARAVHGEPFPPEEAEALFADMPPGFDDREAKTVFGVSQGGEMVGVADVVRGYPAEGTAMIGLLAIHESHQGRGIGAAVARLLEQSAREWGCSRLRIGVVAANEPAFPFWQAIGFTPTGETRPWRDGSVVSEVVVMEKAV